MAQEFHFGDFELDVSSYVLRRGTCVLHIEKLPMELLILLIQRNGEMVSREEIAERLWGKDVYLDIDHGINTAIRKIRRALGDSPENPEFIETVVGKGYRFAAPVICTSNGSGSEHHEAAAPAATQTPPAVDTATARPLLFNWNRRMVLIVVAALVCVLVLGWRVLRSRESGKSMPAIDSLAVLPFVNEGGDANAEYLSDGLTTALIDNLAQVTNLKVISRASVFRYKGSDIDPHAVGRKLAVRAILIGRIVHLGDEIVVSAELVDTRDNRHLWGTQYRRPLTELPAIQKEISKKITDNLRLKLSPADASRLARTGTSDPLAYQLYLRAGVYIAKGPGEDWYKSGPYLEQATARDPAFANAWAMLALYYWHAAIFGCTYQPFSSPCTEMPRELAFNKSEEAARKALALDDNLAEAHTVMGRLYITRDWNFPAGLRELKRAMQLNPNLSEVHGFYAAYLRDADRLDEAVVEAKRAAELDPLGARSRLQVCRELWFARRYEEALQECRRVLEIEPTNAEAMGWTAGVYEKKGMYRQAAEFQVASLRQSGDAAQAVRFERLYKSRGYQAAIRELDAQWLARELRRADPPASDIAYFYARLGIKDEAFRWLDRALAEKDVGILQIRADSDADSLRSDPRYKALIQRMRFPESTSD
jgi:TolB-like protein/DNA-binding winged helix-turn-helix (wHTH) protein